MPRPKPTLLLSNEKERVKWPIIELVGPIDCGKKYMCQKLAEKIGGYSLQFPLLGSGTPVTDLLMKTLMTQPRQLESNPHWWAHIYAASLYESANLINKLIQEVPVIVTNYTGAFRVWSKSLDINMVQFLNGWTVDLPKPSHTYYLDTTSRDQLHSNLNIDLSLRFKTRFNKGIRSTVGKSSKLIEFGDSKFIHTRFNNALRDICADLDKKEKFKQLDFVEFDQTYFK